MKRKIKQRTLLGYMRLGWTLLERFRSRMYDTVNVAMWQCQLNGDVIMYLKWADYSRKMIDPKLDDIPMDRAFVTHAGAVNIRELLQESRRLQRGIMECMVHAIGARPRRSFDKLIADVLCHFRLSGKMEENRSELLKATKVSFDRAEYMRVMLHTVERTLTRIRNSNKRKNKKNK